ncbi:MAG: hypothetical protein PVF22_05830 [Candidatus Aminicenantes bacterium]
MEFEFVIDNQLRKITVEKKENVYVVTDGTNTFEADIQSITPNIISMKVGNRTYRAYIAREKEKRFVQLGGQEFLVQEPSQQGGGFEGAVGKPAEDELIVKAPMPGKVIKINVSENEEVRKNQTLAIVEAMKMENEIKSSIDGVVKKVYCAPGDLVGPENPLIELGSGLRNVRNLDKKKSSQASLG